MIRIESPYGRIYKAPPGLLPSVTTIMKATSPQPFNSKNWIRKIMKNGLSEIEGIIYAEKWIAQGMSREDAEVIARSFIDRPMDYQEAKTYTDWKSPHSANRGNKLHNFLEHVLPVEKEIQWIERPSAKDASTDQLVDSLWKANILQGIAKVVSLEQSLWWFKDGIGYAGSEDISYVGLDSCYYNGDWKSKDPKNYSHTKYAHEYKLQLIAYAAARKQRTGILVDGSHVNFCLSDGSPGEQLIVTRKEAYELWDEWMFRVRAWWSKLGDNLGELRNA
jgi:hypothetical protein